MKKILFVFICLFSLAFFACDTSDIIDNKPTIEDVTVDLDSIPTNVEVSDFDIKDIKFEVKFSDGEVKTFSITNAMLSQEDVNKLKTPGEHVISFTYEGVKREFTIVLVEDSVETPVIPDSTIANVLNSAVGSSFTGLSGYVAGVNAQSFILSDGTNSILVYKGAEWACDVEVGDEVSVSGVTSLYANALQFGKETTYVITGHKEINHSNAKILDGTKINEIAGKETALIDYVTIKGVLAVSGNYYNVTIEGTNYVGSITYPADKEFVNSFNGKEIEITGFYTGISGTKYFNIMYTEIKEVSGEEPTPVVPEKGTVLEALNGELGASYEITGTVLLTNAQSFILTDETGSILVYKGSSWVCDVAAGDEVTISGVTTTYAKAVQFGADTEYTKTGKRNDFAYVDAEVLDGAKVTALGDLDVANIKLVTIKGVLAVSGNYYNVTIEGTNYVGSITYPADKEFVNSFNGKEIEITGFYTGISGTKYFNIMYTEIKEVSGEEPTPVVPEKGTVLEALNGELGASYEITGTVLLTNAQSFILTDETGSILVYKGSSWVCDVAAGDEVTISGVTTTYAKAVQFGADTEYTKTGKRNDFAYVDAEVLDGAKVTALGDLDVANIKLVTIKGVLAVSGNYYNVTIEGTNYVGSITYPADKEFVNSFNGKEIEITGFYTGISGTKYFNIMYIDIDIVDDENDNSTISDALYGELGASYEITGTVLLTNAQSFILTDDTGSILVYKGSSWTCDVAAGDEVTISGVTTTYAKAVQFGADTEYTKTGNKVNLVYGESEELDGAKVTGLADLNYVSVKLVTIKGRLSISNGKYYNLTIEGTDYVGSITYPADTEYLNSFDGKEIIVTGFYTGVSGTKYFNIMYTDIKLASEIIDPDAPIKADIKTAVTGTIGTNYEVTGTVLCTNAQSFLLSDSTGTILVYRGSSWTCDVRVGEEVAVTGKTTTYGNTVQFSADSTYTKTGPIVNVVLGGAESIDGAKVTEIANEETFIVKYVEVKGTLSIASGKYYNVTIEGTDYIGSITYPLDAEYVKGLEGKEIIVTGFYTGISGTKYFNIMYTEIKLA